MAFKPSKPSLHSCTISISAYFCKYSFTISRANGSSSTIIALIIIEVFSLLSYKYYCWLLSSTDHFSQIKDLIVFLLNSTRNLFPALGWKFRDQKDFQL